LKASSGVFVEATIAFAAAVVAVTF